MILARVAGLERIAEKVNLPAMLADPAAAKALLPVLREAALAVLWSGMSIETFAALAPAERDAAVAAGREHAREIACMIGRAARSPIGEAQVRREDDDGDALEALAAQAAFAAKRAEDER